MTQADLFRAPVPEREPEIVVVGVASDLQRFGLAHTKDPVLGVARWFVFGDKLPTHRLRVVWATPRERLPEEFQRALGLARIEDSELSG